MEKLRRLIDGFRGVKISLYAANAAFFIVIAVFPAVYLLLGLLQYTTLDPEGLTDLFSRVFPRALLTQLAELIRLDEQNTSGISIGLSAGALLWSASRGILGLQTGLNAVYGVEENRGWLWTRLLCMVYTLVFLVVLILTLGLHVFGGQIARLLTASAHPVLLFLAEIIDFRFFFLLFVQTAVFTAMYRVLPSGKRRIRDCLPGGLLASSGWLIFSDLYSIYMENFNSLSRIFGSVYALALGMLWLYFCMWILFCGGALNCIVQSNPKK